MKTKKMGEIFQVSGQERSGIGSWPVMSITMHRGLIDQTEKFNKRIASVNTENYKIVNMNELVVGFPIDEGVIGFQTKYPRAIVSPAYDIWKIRENISCSIEYLGRFLRSDIARHIYSSKMRGAVARRRSLTRTDFESIHVPFPSVDDQMRIANVLARAETQIAKRKESIRTLDEFLKSTFLEMFGDPVRNEKGWKRVPMSEILLRIESGRSPVCLDRPAMSGEWGVLKLGSVTQCVFIPNENKALPSNERPNLELEIKKGDILFSRKNTYDLVAACAYVWEAPPKLMMSDLIFRFLLKDSNSINAIFLQKLFSFPSERKAIQRLAGGAAGSMPNISKSKLLNHKIEVPPLSLQNQFAAIVEKVEVIKTKYTESLIELENLYASLSQRAFKGELDLSRIPIKESARDAVFKAIEFDGFENRRFAGNFRGT